MALAVVLPLVGCTGSDDEGSAAGVDPRRDPSTGVTEDAGIRYVVAEDEELVATLDDVTRPGEAAANGPFGLLSAPTRGTLELFSDGRGFRYTPEPDFTGVDGFDYGTPDGGVLRATIDVTPVPDAPLILAVPTLLAERGRPFVARVEARDADGDPLRFEADGLPAWLSLDATDGRLSGTPGQSDVGRVDGVSIGVVDPSGRVDRRAGLLVEVIDPGVTPTADLSALPRVLDARERLDVALFPEDTDLDGIGIAVRTEPFLAGRIVGNRLSLEVGDVRAVTETVLTLALTDRLGQTRSEALALTLRPRTASGLGRTLLGELGGPGIDLVVLGDGYRADQQRLLLDDAATLIGLLREDPGTARHLAAFNVHAIESVSAEAGAGDETRDEVRDTLYGARYGCRGIERLICADTLGLFERALAEYPDLDQLVLLVNDARFGGSGNSGGSVAIAARGTPELVLHEMGHSLAGLADEYVDGALVEALAPVFVEGLYPNVTAIADPARVPWVRWIEDVASAPPANGADGVGVFEGALYRATGLYRPTATSRMREYARPFGPVNSERWVLGVYRMSGTVRAFEPLASRLILPAGDTRRFSVTPFFERDVQSIEWSLDGERVRQADGAQVFEIQPPPGEHTVRLSVSDVSGLIRLPPPHAGVFEWEWELIVR